MEKHLTPITEQQLNELLFSRDSTDPHTQKYLRNKIINIPLVLRTITNPNPGVFKADIHFVDCMFNKKVELGQPRETGNIEFENCIFDDDFTSDAFERITLTVECIFNKNCTLRSNIGIFKIQDLSVTGTLQIQASSNQLLDLKNINIDKGKKKQKVIIHSSSDHTEMENICCDEMIITGLSQGLNTLTNLSCNRLSLNGPWSSKKIDLKSSKANEILLQNISNSANEITISDNCLVGSITIPLSEITRVNISDCEVEKLSLIGTNAIDNIINIESIRNLKELIFDKVFNKGIISLREFSIGKNGRIGMFSSNLGKTDFINCKFDQANFEFRNSKVTELFLSETTFPSSVRFNNLVNSAQSQLAFGQLATAFSKQGDTVRALEYQSREIEAHYNGLSLWSNDFFKTLNLGLNKWSNYFGRYWQLGILFSIVIGILFFYLVVVNSDSYYFDLGFSMNKELFEAFLRFMNPLRSTDLEALFKFDKEPVLKLSAWSYVFDLFGRLFVAYGYYQTIQAFRRFGRK